MKESQKKALDKYKANVKRLTIDFPPSDADLWEHIQSQPKKQTYIKNLIRADMEKSERKRKNCLRCGNSVSEPFEDGRDILHCFDCVGHEGEDVVVLENGYCPNFNN